MYVLRFTWGQDCKGQKEQFSEFGVNCPSEDYLTHKVNTADIFFNSSSKPSAYIPHNATSSKLTFLLLYMTNIT